MTRLMRASALFPLCLAMLVVAALPARALVDIQKVTNPGGLDAWLVEDHSLPFVVLELRFLGGASLDSPDKRGAVNLMTGLLEEGSGARDARAFARAKDAIAAKFSYDTTDDTVSVSARFLTDTQDKAVALLRDSLVAPRFDEAAIERVRAQVLSVIRSHRKDPDRIARDAFAEQVFPDHPYGRPDEGTAESVRALTRADIVAAHQAALARDRVVVSAAGDITPERLSALLDTLLDDLPATGARMPGRAETAFPGGVKVVDYDTPQSKVIFGQPAPARHDPDFFAAYILNHIIGGGGFQSRLMTELREKRGLTYGVYSYIANRRNADLWIGSVASANERVTEAIELIRKEWAGILKDGVTEKQLQDAKTYITGAYALRFDSNRSIADITAGMQVKGMSADYIGNRNARMNAVTLADVNRVARKWLDPDKLTFVVVGQPAGLASTLN